MLGRVTLRPVNDKKVQTRAARTARAKMLKRKGGFSNSLSRITSIRSSSQWVREEPYTRMLPTSISGGRGRGDRDRKGQRGRDRKKDTKTRREGHDESKRREETKKRA